jgi:hypothetical protein
MEGFDVDDVLRKATASMGPGGMNNIRMTSPTMTDGIAFEDAEMSQWSMLVAGFHLLVLYGLVRAYHVPYRPRRECRYPWNQAGWG